MMYPRFFGRPTLRSGYPFEQWSRMRREMDRIMDTMLGQSPAAAHAGVFPAINVTEDDNHYFIRAELPGVDSSDLDVQTTATNLTISGERKLAAEVESARYHRREREGGSFSRAFSLPKEIDPERVEARLTNGILTLRLPKSDSAKPRQINIGG